MATATAKKSQGIFVRQAGAFFRRFHMIMFFVVVVGCIAAVIMLINQTLSESSEGTYTSTISAGTIDQATLDRIQALHDSNNPGIPPTLSDGRVNPFSE